MALNKAMSIKTLSISSILSLILLANTVFAQEQTSVTATSSTAVTASVTQSNTIRLSSLGPISNIRLEVYTANGDLIFDSALRQGNALDWKLAEATQPVSGGTYLFVFTIKDLQGKFRQRLGQAEFHH